ncbi:MAG: glycogen/starch/alpha-glucan phosphorylase, partial [Abditibacteriota bacterium]|nr:glycogen/starch/alpha-glucan phosphorylase [Abditibacteriota bacterium]
MGTLDGANVEIKECVGADNIFIFGLNDTEVRELRPSYDPAAFAARIPGVERILGLVRNDFFCADNPGGLRFFADYLTRDDGYMVMADLESYIDAQSRADLLYTRPEEWARKSILNVARSGYFSSDRSIREYNEKIWGAEPVTVPRTEYAERKG